MSFTEGSRVLLKQKKVRGTIKFIGPVTFDKGEWVGIILDEPVGKNNGTVNGRKYFECPDNHGIFLRKGALVLIENLGEEDSSELSLSLVNEVQNQAASPARVQNTKKKKFRQSMFPMRKSMSMPSIAVEQNCQAAEDWNPPLSNDELFSLSPCNDRKHLVTRYIQGLAKQRLTEAILAKKEEEVRQVKAEKEKIIAGLKDKLAALKNRIKGVKYIEERHILVSEMEEVADSLLRKIEKANTGEIESFVELLKLAEDELPVENMVLPKTDLEMQTCQHHLAETLKILSDYVQLKNSSDCNINKLSDMILEFQKLGIEVRNSSEACSLLEKELKTRILEYKAKSVMLETRNRNRENKEKGTLFLQMQKRTKK